MPAQNVSPESKHRLAVIALGLLAVVASGWLIVEGTRSGSLRSKPPRLHPSDIEIGIPAKSHVHSVWSHHDIDYWPSFGLQAVPAHAAEWLRDHPDNQTLRNYFVSLLRDCPWLLPAPGPLGEERPAKHAFFSPDGRRLVLVSKLGCELWDLTAMRLVTGPLQNLSEIRSAACSPDSRLLATLTAGRLTLWELESGAMSGDPWPCGDSSRVAFTPNGERLLVIPAYQAPEVWDLSSRRRVFPPERREFRFDRVRLEKNFAFSSDGRRLLAKTGGGVVTRTVLGQVVEQTAIPEQCVFFNTDSDEQVSVVLAKGRDVYPVAVFSPDGRRCIVKARTQESILWDSENGTEIGSIGMNAEVIFSPDGTRLLVGRYEHATICDAADGRVLVQTDFPPREPIRPLAFSRDGGRFVVATESTATVCDTLTGRRIALCKREGFASFKHVAFSPDGSVLAAWGSAVALWDADTGRLLCLPHQPELETEEAAFSPDGRFLLVSSADLVRLMALPPGGQRPLPLRHVGTVRASAFSPDGKWLATSTDDDGTHVWDTATGLPNGDHRIDADAWLRQKDTAPPGPDWLRYAKTSARAWSDDGRRLALGFDNSSAVVVDANAREPLTESLWHDAPITNLALSRDGRLLAVTTGNTVWLWNLGPDFSAPEPPWLQRLGRAVSTTSKGFSNRSTFPGFGKLRAELEQLSGDDEWSQFARWFVSTGPDRPIHPGAAATLRELRERDSVRTSHTQTDPSAPRR